jgi:hypothetical protein
MSEQDLLDLLKQARENNEKYNVTGLLLYAKENFMQVLEGEAAIVDEIYEAILRDDRNTRNTIIQRKNIESRNFPQWSMGFKTYNDIPPKMIRGYSNFLSEKVSPEDIEKQQNGILSLLNGFKICTR